MRNVKVYSFSISEEVVKAIDEIVEQCAVEGVTVTRSKVVNTLLDSQTYGRASKVWAQYFCAEDEYKRMKKERESNDA